MSDDELPPELVRVRNSIASELNAQLGLRDEAIVLADVCEVAHAVAFRLGMEFQIRPAAPLSHELPDDDTFGPDGAAFYASLLPPDDSSLRYPVFDLD